MKFPRIKEYNDKKVEYRALGNTGPERLIKKDEWEYIKMCWEPDRHNYTKANKEKGFKKQWIAVKCIFRRLWFQCSKKTKDQIVRSREGNEGRWHCFFERLNKGKRNEMIAYEDDRVKGKWVFRMKRFEHIQIPRKKIQWRKRYWNYKRQVMGAMHSFKYLSLRKVKGWKMNEIST